MNIVQNEIKSFFKGKNEKIRLQKERNSFILSQMKQRYVNQSKLMLKIPIQIDQFSSREIETQRIRLHPPQLPMLPLHICSERWWT
jgi:hypothetical protein